MKKIRFSSRTSRSRDVIIVILPPHIGHPASAAKDDVISISIQRISNKCDSSATHDRPDDVTGPDGQRTGHADDASEPDDVTTTTATVAVVARWRQCRAIGAGQSIIGRFGALLD